MTVRPFFDITQASQKELGEVLQMLNASAHGLSESEVVKRLKHYGPNEVASQKALPWWVQLLNTFNNPFNYLLLALGITSFFTGSAQTLVMIVVMILLSVLLRFFQEFRSNKAAEKLKEMVSIHVRVLRQREGATQSIEQEIPLAQLVPGDIVVVSSGDLIPADVRLISAKELFVTQSALTGESLPIQKQVDQLSSSENELLDLSNMGFMGSSVVSGVAQAVVVNTGGATYFGSLAKGMVSKEEETSFDKGITQLSWLLIRFIAVMVGIIFLINGVQKGNWLEAFLFALTVGVGLTPELLPMIITTNLAKGALKMSAEKVIVKRLSAIQNLGAMDVLCTDKTGTLTQNKIILYKHFDLHGAESLEVLKYAYLNSFFQTGLKNLLDVAILTHAEMEDSLSKDDTYRKLDEMPFDFTRRRMSVVLKQPSGLPLLICKGAVEEVFSACSTILDKGKIHPINPEMLKALQHTTEKLNADGFRVIAIAYKEASASQEKFSMQDEKDLTLMGYVSFMDPPKESASEAISDLGRLGVQVKVLTGDNAVITHKIAETVGLPILKTLLGKQIDLLSDEDLTKATEETSIFAKLTPQHKQRIIQALQRAGHVVGFLGDGINDAPALKAADVGLSVNNAVDIAKESADIILLEQSLLVLKNGVIEGRSVFGNIIKYIRMTTSSNFGNVFSLLGASALLPFLPMRPIHLLIQNLLYDFSQTAIPFDTVDAEYLEKPHKWEINHISRFMLTFGPVSSVFDYATFALMWFVFHANTVHQQALFQSGWFIEGLLSQTFIIHLIRTRKVPFLQSWAAPPLVVLTCVIMGIGVYLPFSPLAAMLGLTALPASYFAWLLLILVCYFALTQVVKQWFMRRFGF